MTRFTPRTKTRIIKNFLILYFNIFKLFLFLYKFKVSLGDVLELRPIKLVKKVC